MFPIYLSNVSEMSQETFSTDSNFLVSFTIMNSLNRNGLLKIMADDRNVQVSLIPCYAHSALKKYILQKKPTKLPS